MDNMLDNNVVKMLNLDGFDLFAKKSERTRNVDRPEEDDDKIKTGV